MTTVGTHVRLSGYGISGYTITLPLNKPATAKQCALEHQELLIDVAEILDAEGNVIDRFRHRQRWD